MAVHDYIKSGDFATEKHVPVIEAADKVKAGEAFDVKLSVGKDIAHPNTVEHHIEWIKLYFVAEGTQLPYEVGELSFNVHGDGDNSKRRSLYMQFPQVHWQYPE